MALLNSWWQEKITPTAVRPGNTFTLSVKGDNNKDITDEVTWTSSNEKVAIIEGDGAEATVTIPDDAVVAGTATIDAKVGATSATPLKITVAKAYYSATDDAQKLVVGSLTGVPVTYTATLYNTESMTLTAKYDGEEIDGEWKETNSCDTVTLDGDTVTATSSTAHNNTIEFYREKGDDMYVPGSLMANFEFREAFRSRMYELMDSTFSYERLHEKLSEWDAVYREQNIETIRRFENSDFDEEAYQEELEKLDDFFRQRRNYMTKYLEEDLSKY